MRIFPWGAVSTSRDNSLFRVQPRPSIAFRKVLAMPVTEIEIEVLRQRRDSIVQSLKRQYKQMARLQGKIEDLENAQRGLDRWEVELFERFNAACQDHAAATGGAIAE